MMGFLALVGAVVVVGLTLLGLQRVLDHLLFSKRKRNKP